MNYIENDSERRGKEGTTVNVRALIGNVVEGLVEDEVLHIKTRSLLKTRGEMYWILDELLTATQPLTEEVTIVEEEKGPWVRRNNIEGYLRAWVSGAGKVGRISGHFGNGKTALVKRMGSELSATGKKVVYVDLLRRTGCIL